MDSLLTNCKILKPNVAVVVATFKRPAELKRLMVCLKKCQDVAVVSICDNAGCSQTKKITQSENLCNSFKVIYNYNSENTGCGAGLNIAIEQAQKEFNGITHYWICDDDIAFEGDVLGDLLKGLERSGAGSAAPALTDSSGLVVAAPMLKHEKDGKRLKLGVTPRETASAFDLGETPEFDVCQGTCHLVTASALKAVGKIREDFWMLGEDLNFAQRIVAHGGGGVFVPWAHVAHLYGAPLDPKNAARSDYLKNLAFMQNLTYMAYRTPYAKYIRGRYFDFMRGRGLVPSYRKFLKKFGFLPFALSDLIVAVFAAWVCGQAAGGKIGATIRKKRFAQNGDLFAWPE